jgi:5-methylcytosine-specific restriction endonuclease McrA
MKKRYRFDSIARTIRLDNVLTDMKIRKVKFPPAKILRALPYKEYLKTDHWKLIREVALYEFNDTCVLCGENENLHVHHKSYEHRGEEHNYPNDLEVLCKECHAHEHENNDG